MLDLKSDQPESAPAPRPKGRLYAVKAEAANLGLHRSKRASEAEKDREAVPAGAHQGGSAPARAHPTRGLSILPPFAAAFAVRFGGTAAAVECPKHITDTQAVIDRVNSRMAGSEDAMSGEVAALVHALLDDARMFLAAARHNHEHPQSPYDHARAFAKADAALGHARAAEVLQARTAQQRR